MFISKLGFALIYTGLHYIEGWFYYFLFFSKLVWEKIKNILLHTVCHSTSKNLNTSTLVKKNIN